MRRLRRRERPGASAGPAPAAGRPGGGATGGIEDAGAGEPGLTARTLSGSNGAGLGAAGQALLSLAILAALARLLAPAEFGVLAIALVFITIAHALGHRNIGAAIVQRAGLTDRHIAAADPLGDRERGPGGRALGVVKRRTLTPPKQYKSMR